MERIAHLDEKGRLVKLEIDGNADGVMERLQYYENERLTRIEADTDNDGRFETTQWFDRPPQAHLEEDTHRRDYERKYQPCMLLDSPNW